MELRMQPLGLMEFFALSILHIAKNSMKPRGRSLNSMN